MKEKTYTIKNDQTAQAVGSGGLAVLATPALIAYMENIAYLDAQELCQEGQTTVGTNIEMKHLAPSAVGKEVVVTIDKREQDRRKINYELSARVDGQLVGQARHGRFIVVAEDFMKNL